MSKEIFGLHHTGGRTIEEATQVISILLRTTERYKSEVNQKLNQLEAFGTSALSKTKKIEDEIGTLIEEWNSKVRKLGAVPKGLWIVDIDSGDGYYCWKYPESSIRYWHDYNSGYTGRIPLEERLKIMGLQASSPQDLVE